MHRINLITAGFLLVLPLVPVGCSGGGGGNQLPTVTITSPRDAEDCLHGETIAFAGTATDPEDGRLAGASLVWTASPGGIIGTGESCTCGYLSIGSYTISLTARDSQRDSASASIRIRVVPSSQPPDVTILGPADGATFFVRESIVFAGSATDPEDGPLTGASLVWTAGILGEIGTGELVTYDELPAATHTITLTATDSEGASASESITIEVRPPNIAPMVMILQPTDNSFFPHYSLIEFEGSSFSRADLASGTHTITLTATDSLGATGRARVTVEVNIPPTVSIYSPAEGEAFIATCPVTFEGAGDDPEDGPLPGDSLVWSSDADGEFGTGELVSYDGLSKGSRIITLTGTDSGGKSGSESVAIAMYSSFVQILSVDSSAFPTIESTVIVNTDAARDCGLVEEDFAVDEDGVPQVIDLVTCAASGGIVADIVVVFDDSGSMSDDVEAMKAEATSLANEVLAVGLDARFGLITTVNSPEIDLPFTDDVAAFQAAVSTLGSAAGGTEPSLDGVMLGLNGMLWRPEALKVFLVITDEPSNGDHYDMQTVINAVNEAGGTVFAVSMDYSDTPPVPPTWDVRELAEETGGVWLDIESADFSVLVEDIVIYLSSLYTVVYTTSNQAADNTQRSLQITVTDPGEGLGWDCDKYQAP